MQIYQNLSSEALRIQYVRPTSSATTIGANIEFQVWNGAAVTTVLTLHGGQSGKHAPYILAGDTSSPKTICIKENNSDLTNGTEFSVATHTGATTGDGTDVDFRKGNKHYLALTANITGTLNLIFPPYSGNFQLLLLHSGGGRTIAGYKAYDSQENLANGDNDVLWPGGNAPTLSGSGDYDILSFYWTGDSSAERAFGVATLDFS